MGVPVGAEQAAEKPAAPGAEEQAAKAPAEGEKALSERAVERTVLALVFGLFQAVLQHVLALQSEIRLFSSALGNDAVATSRVLATATGLSGVAGLFLNQLGGKMSDAFGRKPFLVVGPLVNMLCSLTILRKSDNVPLLTALRVLKSIFVTFSGTVMTNAVLADVLSGRQHSMFGPLAALSVGAAVTFGPFVEHFILKVSGGNPRAVYRVMAAVSASQLISNAVVIPETLLEARRAKLGNCTQLLADINPFSFLQFFCGSRASPLLKKLVFILTAMQCSDGKVTSDLSQLWLRNNLKWGDTDIRNWVSSWGAAVTLSGAFIHPRLLRRLSILQYTTLGNLSILLGVTWHGLVQSSLGMWGALPVLLPGVNGAGSHALLALAMTLSQKLGFGNGELSAWGTNLRAIMQSAATVLVGRWYARCGERGIYQGTAWWLIGFIAAGLPQLLVWTIDPSELRYPGEEEAAKKAAKEDAQAAPAAAAEGQAPAPAGAE